MGYKHTSDDILDGAVEVAYADGIGRVTFGRVAKHLGISDRTVVYYFPAKADLIGAVLTEVGGRLQSALAPAFEAPVTNHLELARRTLPLLADPAADATIALFFEGVGLATGRQAPFSEALPVLIEAWVAWAAALIALPAEAARAEAVAAVALIDGVLLMRQTLGPDAAASAAQALGIA